jgi:cell pole-organizing protein PopZ
MSAENAQREPTMEEILASIRRIISEEDKPPESGGDVLELAPPPAPAVEPAPVAEVKAPPPAAEVKAPPPAPPPEPVIARAPPPEIVDEPEEIAPPPPPMPRIEDDIVIVERTPDLPPPAPAPVAAPAPAPKAEWTPPMQDTLVSEPVASQTAGALGKLMGTMMVTSGNTLDDVVRAMLKPLLKEWLDANLTQLVEAEVAKEIDRIRRMAR